MIRRRTIPVLPVDWIDEKDSRPASNVGAPDWQTRWDDGKYDKLKTWQLCWGILRHNPEYLLDWPDVRPGDFGLREKIDPATTAFELAANPFAPPVHHDAPRVIRSGAVTLTENEIAVVLDRTRPLGPQLEKIKSTLPKAAAKARLRRDQLPFYVCLLDARAAGARPGEIARALWPDADDPQQKLKDARRAARALVWGGDLAALAHRGK